MIITIAGEKGGTGKSTIAINLSVYTTLSLQKKTLLIDADPQKSSLNWADLRREKNITPSPIVLARTGKALDREVKELESTFDIIIIDTGGRDSIEMRKSMIIADAMITPVSPGQFDAWSLEKTVTLYQEAKSFNPKLTLLIALNRIPFLHTIKDKEIQDMISFVNELKTEIEDCHLLKNYMVERIDYKKTISEGISVVEISENKKAKEEFENLCKELFTIIEKRNKK